MGGFLSGRPRERVLVEDCLTLDASFLRKLDCFAGLARKRLKWTRDGKVSATGRIDVFTFPQERPRAVVKLDGLPAQTIELTSTRPDFGGERWWFVCPTTGSMCRTLYLTPSANRFVSRQAANIAYRSNTLGFAGRVRWRAEQLRDSLPGARFQSYPARPKGMHRKTYDRIVNRLREADENARLVWYGSMRKTANRLGLFKRPPA